MSRLIAFGSSIIMMKNSFPELLAEQLSRDYVSRVKPTNSNHKIARMVLSQSYEPNDIVLVDWTTTIRHEFRTEKGWQGISMATYKPGCGFEEQWYQGPGRWEYTGVSSSLKEIILAQTFLVAQNIPYVFTFDYDDIIESNLLEEPDDYIGSLKNLIDWSRVKLFDDQGFLSWCRKNNYEFDGSHPKETAHVMAADYLLDKFKLSASHNTTAC